MSILQAERTREGVDCLRSHDSGQVEIGEEAMRTWPSARPRQPFKLSSGHFECSSAPDPCATAVPGELAVLGGSRSRRQVSWSSWLQPAPSQSSWLGQRPDLPLMTFYLGQAP
ncbi:hypothetical protein H8959_017401 [Pygathrix nigripes]